MAIPSTSKTIFDFRDYKTYLLFYETDVTRGMKAFRSKLSTAIGCQAAYVSQILNGDSHFSLEQAVLMNPFLAHDRKEAHFFILLVQYARSGNSKLRSYFIDQIEEVEKERTVLKSRVGVKNSLTEEDKAIYYSQWYFAAIHVLVTISNYQNIEQISQRLSIDKTQVKKALDFLERAQLISKDAERFSIGKARIHLGQDSTFIGLHHSNWRLKSLEYARQEKPENLHYSSVITISESDRVILRNMIIDCIDDFKKVVRDSKEQDVFAFSADFFRL